MLGGSRQKRRGPKRAPGRVWQECRRIGRVGGDGFRARAVEEARKRAEEAVKPDRDQLHARWLLAELARTSGRLDEADRAYQGLVDFTTITT